LAAFTAGYISLFAGAIFTATELGIQPLIAVSPDGRPLYSPYPLSVAIPVMAIGNLLVFGIVEGLITALLFKYFCKHNINLIEILKA
jgi:cobalt/nickel transport system permease protein